MDTSTCIADRADREDNRIGFAANLAVKVLLERTMRDIVSANDESSSIAKELSNLKKICKRAMVDISSSRNVRETLEIADVGVPNHLRAIVSTQLPALQRLSRLRDIRVEEVVKGQIDLLSREHCEFVASREFDHLKATDWPMLWENYPELYWKALREANLIINRKNKR